MGMRSMRRQIARHMMELAERKPGQAIARAAKKKSYFALHWKAYLDPESDERKALHAKLKREFALARRKAPTKRMIQPWPLRNRVLKPWTKVRENG